MYGATLPYKAEAMERMTVKRDNKRTAGSGKLKITRLMWMQRQLLACVGVSGCVYAAYKYKAVQTEVGGAPEATCLGAHPGA